MGMGVFPWTSQEEQLIVALLPKGSDVHSRMVLMAEVARLKQGFAVGGGQACWRRSLRSGETMKRAQVWCVTNG